MNGLFIRGDGPPPIIGPQLEPLEQRLLLSGCAYDLDADSFVGAGDDAVLSPAWHAQGGYSFSDALTHPAATPGWNHLCDFDGDFLVGSGDYAWLSTNWGKFATDPSIVFPADPHDADESMALADAQGALPQYMWFSEWYGRMAIANDGDDYFRIEVPDNGPVVTIDCRYEYSSGNIDIELLDSTGAQVAVSAYTVDNELLVKALPTGGTYYIHVVSPNGPTGQRYDLWWLGQPPTDYHEDDENQAEAATHGNFPQDTWYSQVYGVPGVSADVDYFMIDVPASQRLITVDCTFRHAEGNIGLYVVDDSYQIVAFSSSLDDNEHIEFLLSSGGTHYIQVFNGGGYTGQTYDLIWHTEETPLQAVEDTAVIDEDSVGNVVNVLANDLGTGLVITQVGSGWTDGSFVYITPYPNYSGFSYFSYQIQEPGGVTDWGFIAVTINPIPDDPIAQGDSVSLPEDNVAYVIDVLGNDSDPDGDSLTIQSAIITSGTPIGTAWTDGSVVYYTPNPGVSGPETLEYTVNDGTGRTDTAIVDIWVMSGEESPVAVDDHPVVGMRSTTSVLSAIDVMDNDYDPDGQTFSIVAIPTLPTKATAWTDGLIIYYSPGEGEYGFDSFEYTIEDSTGRQDTATAYVHIIPNVDPHENDDDRLEADMQGDWPEGGGFSYLLDDDYWRIDIPDGADDRVIIHAWNCSAVPGYTVNLDLELLDANGTVVTGAYTTNDDEWIDTTDISAGVYYLRFFTVDTPTGQSYAFNWDATGSADPHEMDNTLPQSDAQGAMPEGKLFAGIYNDDDLYRFEVTSGNELVLLNCQYDPEDGNLNLAVCDFEGTTIETFVGSGAEVYAHIVLPIGTYYARVYAPVGPTGQGYTLYWRGGSAEDGHENDDNIAQAKSRQFMWEGSWFDSQVSGDMLTHTDDDYYEINVNHGYEHVTITCTFDYTKGDIDIWLLDANGTVIDGSTGSGPTEIIDTTVPSHGEYYVRITNPGGATGQFYDAIWQGFKTDDSHEEDDSIAQARYALPLKAEAWFDGRSWDKDYHLITVPQGHLDVEIDLRFIHSRGDLDMRLETADGQILASSITATDNEYINSTLNSAGEYYVRIAAAYGDYKGQDYQLWWNASFSDDTHEEDDTDAQADAQGDFPEGSAFYGTQWDDDYFRLNVPTGQEHISINLNHDQAEGNLSLWLFDSGLSTVATGTQTDDGDFIEMTLSSAGVYYLAVVGPAGGPTGQSYELTWNAMDNDDSHESDDTVGQAFGKPLLDEGVWFHGRLLDRDLFRITVPAGQPYITANCLFNHNEARVSLKLLDSAGNYVAGGESGVYDDESVLHSYVSGGETYYISVSVTAMGSQYVGQYYDVKWSAYHDDWHEQDDTFAEADATDLVAQNTLVEGILHDNDIWRIYVASGRETVLMDCFADEGDSVHFSLYDSQHQLVETTPVTDGFGKLAVSVPAHGIYYVKVDLWGTESGQSYSFSWKDAPRAQYDWTIIWYLAADNNLDNPMWEDLMETEFWPTGTTAFTWLFDGSGYGDTRRKAGDSFAIENVGELDMGNPDTLRDFIQWAVDTSPARNYCLIVDDHGTTWAATCTDDRGQAGSISTSELADAISAVRPMDVVMFSTCNSMTVEVAYELRHLTDYVVGHESTNISGSWDMKATLGFINHSPGDPSPTPYEVARNTVHEYYLEWKGESDGQFQTMSAVGTDYMDELGRTIAAFADEVLYRPQCFEIVGQARDMVRAKYGGDTMVDLGSFMDKLINWGLELPTTVRNAAKDVRDAYDMVVKSVCYFNDFDPTGMTIYFPDTPGLNGGYTYEALEFLADTRWEDLLRRLDDSHEEDDMFSTAGEKGDFTEEEIFTGTMWDTDYFRIVPAQGEIIMHVDCEFFHAQGDIDLYLYDKWGAEVASSKTTTDDEHILCTVPYTGGTYYYWIGVKPVGSPGGHNYRLAWYAESTVAGGSLGSAAMRSEQDDPAPASLIETEDGDGIAHATDSTGRIDVELVVLPAPSPTDTSGTLPAGVAEIEQLSPFVVEVWVRNVDGSSNGITGGYVSIQYDWNVTANALRTGGIYTSFPTSTPIDMWVESLGGQAPLGQLAYGDDEWVRLGYAEFTADDVGTCYLSSYPGEDTFARAHEGAVDWIDVEFDDPMVEFDVVEATPGVVGRYIFYNESVLDDYDPEANASDDSAIAADKQALMPGETPTASNFTNYRWGINGIMLDTVSLFDMPDADDFLFRAGNSGDPAGWAMAVVPSITIRPTEGKSGSDRVTMIWSNGEIAGCWLQVTVLSDLHGGSLGLADDDVFYFGNLPGGANGDGVVDAADYIALKRNFGSSVTEPGGSADFDCSGTVDYGDLLALISGVGLSISMDLSAAMPAQEPDPVTPPVTDVAPDILTEPAVRAAGPEQLASSADDAGGPAMAILFDTDSKLPAASLTAGETAGILDALARSASPKAGMAITAGAFHAEPQARLAVRLGTLSISSLPTLGIGRTGQAITDALQMDGPWLPEDSASRESCDEQVMITSVLDIAARIRKDPFDPIGPDLLAVRR